MGEPGREKGENQTYDALKRTTDLQLLEREDRPRGSIRVEGRYLDFVSRLGGMKKLILFRACLLACGLS
jgi:hypothetical protein